MNNSNAIVIGSGLGGLAAAIRLGARGYKVTVCEKLDAPGGRAYVYRQDGFTFDAGPGIVTAPFLLEELWTLCGKRMSDHVHLREISPFYTIRFDDGSSFNYSGDSEAMKSEISRINPEDVAGYERLQKISARLYKVGFEKLSGLAMDSRLRRLRVRPGLMRAQFTKSLHELVSHHIEHPKLRMVFTFHVLLVGGNPYSATALYALIPELERRHGVHCVMGGTGSLVKGLVSLIESQGGKLCYNASVKEILVEGRRAIGVELESGERLQANVVVSNADAATTYHQLVPAGARRRWTERKLRRARYSMSLFVWYFGTDRQYPGVSHHTMLLGSRYRELFDDIFEKKKLAEDFFLYLHRPTAVDPSLAPPGCDAFYVLSPVPHQDSGLFWPEVAESYRDAIADYLSATVLPGLDEHVVVSRMLTPLDFEQRLSSLKGAAFGMEPVPGQMLWRRPHNRSEKLDGLYLVGAGTHPGAGVPGVLSSAKILDDIVPDPTSRHGR